MLIKEPSYQYELGSDVIEECKIASLPPPPIPPFPPLLCKMTAL